MSAKSGVISAKKADGTIYYRASITYHNKHISLGSYSSQQQAHSAYQSAKKQLSSTVPLDEYPKKCVLPFDKWVTLTNYRDHQVYIRNPIYLRHNYFEYYLDQDTILKFDIDDLFYYSEHRILRRGGHLFVADYGMQVSITDRYGIKPYAVLNKDYRFMNQDTCDYRYENIEIINHYNGVSMVHRSGITVYKAIIHIRSNYVIGYFQSEINAAIAYNKAVDFLRKNGINRNYATNYIESVSPSVYADIYAGIVLPDSILSFGDQTISPHN